jgi:hypothetical protein
LGLPAVNHGAARPCLQERDTHAQSTANRIGNDVRHGRLIPRDGLRPGPVQAQARFQVTLSASTSHRQTEVENSAHLVFELLQVALQGCQAVDVVADGLADRGRVGIQSVKEVLG